MGRVIMPLVLVMLASLLSGCGSKDAQTDGLEERSWQVPANLHELLMSEEKRRIREEEGVDLFEGGTTVCIFPPDTLPGIFDAIFNIPFPNEASLRFSPNDGELVVRHHPDQLDQLDEFIRSLGSLEQRVIDRKIFHPIGAMVINGGDDSEGLVTRKWHSSKEVIEALSSANHEEMSGPNPFVDPSDPPPLKRPKPTLQQEFMYFGISFPEGASIAYDAESGMLTCVNQLSEAARIELLLLMVAFDLAEKQAGE